MSDSTTTTTATNQPPSIFDACEPRQDVLTGELAEDQFAASLADVAHSSDAPDVYADPRLFFEKTFPTSGLQELLTHLTTRFVGAHNDDYTGTNGILRLDTSFGGGKTHNQIAAYHLAESPSAVPDLSDFILEQDVANEYTDAAALGLDVNTAVFVGTHVDAEDARSNYDDPDSPTTKTMWGEMAYQLFGREGYEFLRENDENRTPPGTNKLERLFDRNDNPSLILIDEIAAYLEQAAAVEIGDSTLAKQTNTFLMSLLSATQNNDKVTVVLSIADTTFANQAEDVRGLVSESISEFNSISDRVESSITPTEDNEIAAVLSHRLFEHIDPNGCDETVDAYASFYTGDRDSFPEGATSPEYRDRLEDNYPIHPTVIDTLTEELDSLPSFQRTRGALKLLSRGVYRLWQQQDDENHTRHYVRLFDLHPSDGDVRSTLLRLFSSVDMDFEAAIKADIYSEDGTANAEEEDRNWVKNGHPVLGTHLTTTILWKSIVKGADGRGTTRRPLRHAVANIEVELAHYDDALNNLLGEGRRSACFFLHGDNGEKIQFKSEPNLTKLVDSVVEQLQDGLARRHLEEALDEALGQGSLNVIVGPEEPHEIPDMADEAHLSVMDFDTVTITDYETVPETIQTLFKNTASSSGGQKTPRVYKNNVVFLAASANDVTDAERTAERVAAIKHIQNNLGNQYELNTEQQDKLGERLDGAKGTLDQDIKKAYTHLYFPTETGLTHRNVTTDSTIHQSVIEKLDEAGAIIPEGEDAYGVDWFEATIWNVGTDSMTTRAIEEQFGKRQGAEILLSPIPLRKTIAQLVREDDYAYWDDEQSTGYYTSGARLTADEHELNDAKNLHTALSYQDVKLSQLHMLYTSPDELVADIGSVVEWEVPEEEETEVETIGSNGDDTSVSEGSSSVGGDDLKPFSKLIEVRTSEPAHISRALQEMRADIADELTSAREEYDGHPDELTPIVEGVWIHLDGADAWKGTWFTANKLSNSEDFAEDTTMDFEYEANDGANSQSEFGVDFEGRPDVFASHLRFNMEPEDLSNPNGGRTAEAEFAVGFDEGDDRLYGDTFDTLDELLAVDNAFTVTMHAQIRVVESSEVAQI